MSILNLEHVSKNLGGRVILDEASVGIEAGEKVGIIGVNGTGKSTLLSIVAKVMEPDEGEVIWQNGLRISYLLQNPVFDPKRTLLENVAAMVYGKADHWDTEGEVRANLLKFGIPDPDTDPSLLSGGQKKRAALVAAMLTPSDVLILDEPTNHLDHAMSEWLEEYLIRFRGAILMVTHDRYFLDRVVNRIVEVDKGKLYSYPGNYSEFVRLKEERESMELATERKRKSLLRTELEWLHRGARARSTKQKAHIDRIKAMQEMKDIQAERRVQFDSAASRMGNKTIELSGISKSYGERCLIRDYSYIFLRNDRIGIIGPNGCGKSTLLKIINGIAKPDRGTVEVGQTIRMGYFSQENEYMDTSLKVIDYIKEVGEYITTSDGKITASQMLERFLFDGAMQWSPIEKLSGGERRRLYLLRILMGAPNVLILDEPTNDLDIQTLTILEDYLDHFAGIIIIVSHDRYFLDRTVNRIFAFEGDGVIRQSEGGYSDYLIRKELETISEDEDGRRGAIPNKNNRDGTGTTENQKQPAKDTWKQREKKLRFTYKEQKEFETIDDDIARLEAKIENLDEEILKNATNSLRLGELVAEKEGVEAELEEKMERWVYLNDLNERIQEAKE